MVENHFLRILYTIVTTTIITSTIIDVHNYWCKVKGTNLYIKINWNRTWIIGRWQRDLVKKADTRICWVQKDQLNEKCRQKNFLHAIGWLGIAFRLNWRIILFETWKSFRKKSFHIQFSTLVLGSIQSSERQSASIWFATRVKIAQIGFAQIGISFTVAIYTSLMVGDTYRTFGDTSRIIGDTPRMIGDTPRMIGDCILNFNPCNFHTCWFAWVRSHQLDSFWVDSSCWFFSHHIYRLDLSRAVLLVHVVPCWVDWTKFSWSNCKSDWVSLIVRLIWIFVRHTIE